MTDLEDGIYFSLPAADYHALPRLSASGIANMLVDPPTYWAGSWMNPNRKDEETDAKIIGAAYHVARLEPWKFHECYIREIDPADFPEIITNGTGLAAALEERGQTKKKAGETVLEQAHRLRAAGYGGPILHLLQEKWEEERRGRVGLSPEIFDQIEADMAAIQSSDQIRPLLENGYAEVSILWTDPKTGVRMKARIDYLRADGWADFKSFDNPRKKRIDQCLADAFMYNRYYIQAVFYHQAIEAARAIGALNMVDHGTHSAENVEALLAEIYNRPDPLECHYVFQQKNGVPNLLARKIELFAPGAEALRLSAMHIKARNEINWAAGLFKFYREEFGDDPWPPLNPTGTIGDEDFPTYWLERE